MAQQGRGEKYVTKRLQVLEGLPTKGRQRDVGIMSEGVHEGLEDRKGRQKALETNLHDSPMNPGVGLV